MQAYHTLMFKQSIVYCFTMTSARIFFLSFLKKKELAEDVFCYFFDKKNSEFSFRAGQYVQMTLPHDDVDDRGSSRYFTLSSSPTESEYLFITTRIGQSSFKKTLFHLKPGTKVQFFGPMGAFVLPEV
jgi:ferredoxin-NADP reductase